MANISPTDFIEGRQGDMSVIVTEDLQDILRGVRAGVSVTVVFDCDHTTSVLDVAGTLDGELVKGVKSQAMMAKRQKALDKELGGRMALA